MGSRHILRAALIGALTLGAGGAFAQTKIGGAAVVKNDVRGQLQSGTSRIAQGDGVFQDEDVRTATDSLAKLVLLDDTNVSVGPSSRIKLDKFVYNSNAGAPQVTMNATKGVFRFISGVSPHDAYSIQTPEASIGVRGTTYDVRVLGGETMVTLQDGVVHVCVRGTQRCVDLDTPGQSVRVTRSGIDGPIPPERKTWDFGSLCAGLCAPTQFASLPPAIERPPVKATRAAPRLRVRHAAATPSPPPQPRVVHKTRTVERHIPRKPRRIGRASRDDDDDDVVYGGPPAVYLPPPGFGYGPYGGYRGGYGGGYGGGGYRGGGYGGGGYGGRGGGGGRGAR